MTYGMSFKSFKSKKITSDGTTFNENSMNLQRIQRNGSGVMHHRNSELNVSSNQSQNFNNSERYHR